MTVLELYTMALSLLNELDTDAKDYPKLKLPYINLLLAQSFATENWIRRSKGAALLTAVPIVHKDSDVLVYDDNFVRECLPYALAAMLATDEDRELSNVYSKMYTQLEDKYLKVFAERITDVYGGGGDENAV